MTEPEWAGDNLYGEHDVLATIIRYGQWRGFGERYAVYDHEDTYVGDIPGGTTLAERHKLADQLLRDAATPTPTAQELLNRNTEQP